MKEQMSYMPFCWTALKRRITYLTQICLQKPFLLFSFCLSLEHTNFLNRSQCIWKIPLRSFLRVPRPPIRRFHSQLFKELRNSYKLSKGCQTPARFQPGAVFHLPLSQVSECGYLGSWTCSQYFHLCLWLPDVNSGISMASSAPKRSPWKKPTGPQKVFLTTTATKLI